MQATGRGRWIGPGPRALARVTFLETVRQPVFLLLLLATAALIFASRSITFFGFGREAMLVREMGLASMVLAGLLLALFAAGRSLHDELEARTHWTLLAKPFSREGYVLAKLAGILAALLVAMLALAGALAATLVLAGAPVDLALGMALGLALLEVALLAAIATCLSIVFPLAVTAALVISVYAAGHLIDYAAGALEQGAALGGVVSHLLRMALPNLENFNVLADLATGVTPTTARLLWTVVYFLIAFSAWTLAALWLMRRRDG